MNRAFLGDALDFWKGALLSQLQQFGVLNDLRVDAMFTDPPWGQPELTLYANLLGQPLAAIVPHEATLANRQEYFAEIPGEGDIFLDPDTGVRTSGSRSPAHVDAAELDGLLLADRLAIVYQHISRISVVRRLHRVTLHLHENLDGLQCCSANSATVALLFLSREPVRIQAVTEALQHIYGPMAEARTCVWPAAQQSHRRTRPRPATHIARKPFRPATELMA